MFSANCLELTTVIVIWVYPCTRPFMRNYKLDNLSMIVVGREYRRTLQRYERGTSPGFISLLRHNGEKVLLFFFLTISEKNLGASLSSIGFPPRIASTFPCLSERTHADNARGYPGVPGDRSCEQVARRFLFPCANILTEQWIGAFLRESFLLRFITLLP